LALGSGSQENSGTERLIALTNSPFERALLRLKGCSIVHELSDSTAIECPIGLGLDNVVEDTVYTVMDSTSVPQINADDVHDMGYTGEGVVVAVLDTGIDLDHPELIDNIAGGQSFVSYTTSYDDDAGHGTHVSGIITAPGVDANAIGVAPDAGIWMAKVCDSGGSCYGSDIVAAIEYVVNNDIADIMSISLGGGGTTDENCDGDSLAAKVNWAVDNGVTVVVAAGNDGKVVSSPACASGAIAVGAVDSNDDVPYWSGRGKALDIVAPGVSIYSSVPGGYDYYSGTSMSCPHVSGVVALLRSVDSTLTDSAVKDAMYTTATPVNKCYQATYRGPFATVEEVECTTDMTGAGVVDALGAVNYLTPAEPDCEFDADCDDGLYCNGAETCDANGFCQSGESVVCTGDQCNDAVCVEEIDGYSCSVDPVVDGTSCDDGFFCTEEDTCQSGICTSDSVKTCDDGESCTADSCNIDSDACENTWPSCGIADGCCEPGVCTSETDVDCSSCGNGVCDSGEDCNTCSADCIKRGRHCCGDGSCTGPEPDYCSVDCATSSRNSLWNYIN